METLSHIRTAKVRKYKSTANFSFKKIENAIQWLEHCDQWEADGYINQGESHTDINFTIDEEPYFFDFQISVEAMAYETGDGWNEPYCREYTPKSIMATLNAMQYDEDVMHPDENQKKRIINLLHQYIIINLYEN